jgi:hypothetical protein
LRVCHFRSASPSRTSLPAFLFAAFGNSATLNVTGHLKIARPLPSLGDDAFDDKEAALR